MRYDRGHGAESRKRITQSASQLFRRDGIGATGVAAVMSATDLTHGAFYWHFESKERLVCEALAEAQGARLRWIERCLSTSVGGVEAVIRDYLSRGHVANAATGCASAALAPEVARSSLLEPDRLNRLRKVASRRRPARMAVGRDVLPGSQAR